MLRLKCRCRICSLTTMTDVRISTSSKMHISHIFYSLGLPCEIIFPFSEAIFLLSLMNDIQIMSFAWCKAFQVAVIAPQPEYMRNFVSCTWIVSKLPEMATPSSQVIPKHVFITIPMFYTTASRTTLQIRKKHKYIRNNQPNLKYIPILPNALFIVCTVV